MQNSVLLYIYSFHIGSRNVAISRHFGRPSTGMSVCSIATICSLKSQEVRAYRLFRLAVDFHACRPRNVRTRHHTRPFSTPSRLSQRESARSFAISSFAAHWDTWLLFHHASGALPHFIITRHYSPFQIYLRAFSEVWDIRLLGIERESWIFLFTATLLFIRFSDIGGWFSDFQLPSIAIYFISATRRRWPRVTFEADFTLRQFISPYNKWRRLIYEVMRTMIMVIAAWHFSFHFHDSSFFIYSSPYIYGALQPLPQARPYYHISWNFTLHFTFLIYITFPIYYTHFDACGTRILLLLSISLIYATYRRYIAKSKKRAMSIY